MARSETLYLHLRKNYNNLDVVKMAKSKDATIRPGDVLVKLKISVPDSFFEEAIPYVQVEIPPQAAIRPDVNISPDPEPEDNQ